MPTTLHTDAFTVTPTCILADSAHTALAEELNAAMAADEIAQLAYFQVWGVEWVPLPLNGCDTKPAMTDGRASRAVLGTVR